MTGRLKPLNDAKNNTSFEHMLRDVPDEYYNTIKEFKDDIISNFNFIKTTVIAEHTIINKKLGKVSDKEFAEYIKYHTFKSMLFSLRKNKCIDRAIWTMIKPEFKIF